MTIASEITRLQTAKSDIKTAIESKGVSVPSSAKLDTYDDYISSISQGEEVYKGEYIEYYIKADSNGRIYVPVSGRSHSNMTNCPYNWKVTTGSTTTTYSGTGSSGGSIVISGKSAGYEYNVKIEPVTESYGWALAYGWAGTAGATYLMEVIYDCSYMGYAESATNTGNYFRYSQYNGCTGLVSAIEEYIPDTVTTIGQYFRGYQYYNTKIVNIKGWVDYKYGNSTGQRDSQFSYPNTYRTITVKTGVGYNNYSNCLNSSILRIYVPNKYLNDFKNTNNYPRSNFNDSIFVGY